jgi:hypothetical protein
METTKVNGLLDADGNKVAMENTIKDKSWQMVFWSNSVLLS